MSFRFNAQKVYLTYSQTKAKQSPEYLLRNISKIADVEEYLISQERHKDGGYHLHAYFKFTKKLDKRSARVFDLSYYNKSYHPNIQVPKKRFKLFHYIKKDKSFITNILETRPAWEVMLDESDNEEDFLYSLMRSIGRYDNYAGYRTLRDLFQIKLSKTTIDKYLAEKLK